MTALVWLPDNSGFISAALDHRIIQWVSESFLPSFVYCVCSWRVVSREKRCFGIQSRQLRPHWSVLALARNTLRPLNRLLLALRELITCPCFPQDTDGKRRDDWGPTVIRITDLAVTPDLTRLVTVGMFISKPPTVSSRSGPGAGGDGGASSNSGTPGGIPASGGRSVTDHQMITYDMATKQVES